MTIPKVRNTMSSSDQNTKLYGQIYQEFDFSKSLGIMALAKELLNNRRFERLFRRTKVLFVQRLEEYEE